MKSSLVVKDSCLQKLDSVISTIDGLLGGDYPHRDSITALKAVRALYTHDRDLLLTLTDADNDDTILEWCRHANTHLCLHKEVLGLLIRSSHIRNAFENYFPIKSIARQLLREKVKVVLSSEWEFSPFMYPPNLASLSKFVFIGMPASECQNPLIMPLAGHEMGHVVWRKVGGPRRPFETAFLSPALRNQFQTAWTEFSKLLKDQTIEFNKLETELFLREYWKESLNYAKRQCEEIFCDFVGIHIFGASYLHSFRYLVAPSFGGERVYYYPRMTARAQYLVDCARECGISVSADFSSSFDEKNQGGTGITAFLARMADQAVASVSSDLVQVARNNLGLVDIFSAYTADEVAVRSAFDSLVPATGLNSVAPIINSAWEIRNEIDTWMSVSQAPGETLEALRSRKIRILRDLVLKSFEVYEVEKRILSDAA